MKLGITQKELKETLNYDPETGSFTWIKSKSKKIKLGDRAGSYDHYGYVTIKINKENYKAHRLAYLYMNGEFPEKHIDHINGNPSDNSFSNIRSANNFENQRNRKLQKNNKSGYKGVCWSKRDGVWITHIRINGKHTYLGTFSDKELAHKAYCEAAKENYKEFANFG